MVHLKRCIVEVRAEEKCLAHSLTIAIARLNNNANYKDYRQGRKKHPAVEQLLVTTGIDLKKGDGPSELTKYQQHFHVYMIAVYAELNCESIMFQGHLYSYKGINLLKDEVSQHYLIITNLLKAMAKQ